MYYIPAYDHYNFIRRMGDFNPDTMSALDLGCGAYVSEVARQVIDIPFKRLTSVEGYKKDFEAIPRDSFKAKEHLLVNDDIMHFLDNSTGSFDVVFAFDVIEHLTKEDGERLLDILDKRAKMVVIFVPDEPEGFHRVWEDGNVLQNHLSYWREEDLTARGYEVERVKNAHSDRVEDKEIHFDALWAIKKV